MNMSVKPHSSEKAIVRVGSEEEGDIEASVSIPLCHKQSFSCDAVWYRMGRCTLWNYNAKRCSYEQSTTDSRQMTQMLFC